MGEQAAPEDKRRHTGGDTRCPLLNLFQNEVVATAGPFPKGFVGPDGEDSSEGQGEEQLGMGEAQRRDAVQTPQKQGAKRAGDGARQEGQSGENEREWEPRMECNRFSGSCVGRSVLGVQGMRLCSARPVGVPVG